MRIPRFPVSAPLILLSLLLLVPGSAAGQEDPGSEPDYRALWESGSDYEAFYDAITARRALWERNTATATVPEELLDRARAVPGPRRLLIVAFDRCSDSVGTIPYIAALVEAVDGLEMRIIPPAAGRPIMEAHRTPDGRPATPTVLLLDGEWEPVGAWVERPSELQAWYIENPEGLSHDARYDGKMEWYEGDAGESTVREIVGKLEGQG